MGFVDYTFYRLQGVIALDDIQELLSQDREKRPAGFTDGEGKTTHYEYGAFDLLTAVIRPDGQRLECRYDKTTRLTGIVNAAGENYRLEYDRAGQLISETDFTGRTLRYEYDAAGRCTATQHPDGRVIRRHYDNADHLLQQQVWQKTGDTEKILSVTAYRYDTRHRLIQVTSPDAVVGLK